MCLGMFSFRDAFMAFEEIRNCNPLTLFHNEHLHFNFKCLTYGPVQKSLLSSQMFECKQQTVTLSLKIFQENRKKMKNSSKFPFHETQSFPCFHTWGYFKKFYSA